VHVVGTMPGIRGAAATFIDQAHFNALLSDYATLAATRASPSFFRRLTAGSGHGTKTARPTMKNGLGVCLRRTWLTSE